MKKAFEYLTLSLGILVLLSSCSRQGGTQSSMHTKKTIELGKVVTELSPTIWDIYQDKASNYWFGSKEDGLFCYDGQVLKQFTIEDGLVSNEIRGIQEDAAGNLYFETMAGVSQFDGHSFHTIPIKDSDSTATDWKLTPNDLWFRIGFNNKGPYRYDGEYLHYLEFPKSPQEVEFYKQNPQSRFSPYGIYEIYKDQNGFMWFGTSGIGLCRFDGQSISWHYEEQLQKTKSGGDFGTRAIFQDKDGLFWFNNSRYRYEILSNSTIHLDYRKKDGVGYMNEESNLEYPHFLSITQDAIGEIWMVTYQDGVWRNNGTTFTNYPVKDGETDVLLFSIYRDKQGDLWLGTHNAGAYKFNGKSFEKFRM